MSNALRRTGVKSRVSLARIMEEIGGFAAMRGDEIVTRVMPRWISLSSRNGRRVFAELRPSRERVQVFVLPPPSELGGCRMVARAPVSQGWGWFKSKFFVEGDGDVRVAIRLLRVSYIYSLMLASHKPRRSGQDPRR